MKTNIHFLKQLKKLDQIAPSVELEMHKSWRPHLLVSEGCSRGRRTEKDK